MTTKLDLETHAKAVKAKKAKDGKKPAAKPTQAAKDAKKLEADVKVAKAAKTGGLTGNQTKTLAALAKASKPLTRNDLREKTGILKGWSGILGATSKEDGGVAGEKGLVNAGLVKAEKFEDSRGYHYSITAKGRKELEKVG